jgi:hypothetical protein
MGFVSGLYQICASSECDCIDLVVVRESWDDEAGIFVGEQRCSKCDCRMLFSRRPSSPMEIQMAKKKAGKPRGKKKPEKRAPVTHRVNTIKGNGAMPTSTEIAPAEPTIGEAMRLAVEALGDVVIDENLAPAQMRELAEAYERVTEEKAAFDKKNDAAKVAKKAWESAQNLLLEKVRAFTHPAPLPLFDQQQAEDDEDAMLDGGDDDDAAGEEATF